MIALAIGRAILARKIIIIYLLEYFLLIILI